MSNTLNHTDLTKKSVSDIENKGFSLKPLRIITNDGYPGYIWLTNTLFDKGRNLNETVIKLFFKTSGEVAHENDNNSILKMFRGEYNNEFNYIGRDVMREIDVNGYFLISEYAKANGLRINLKKGTVIKCDG